MTPMSWDSIPELLLLNIFNRLSRVDVYHCSLSCKHWYRVSCDNGLWKRLFHRDFKIRKTVPIRDENSTWKEEYIRLIEDIPTVLSQTLTAHTDEVLYVTFCHDGSEFVSCSKDHRLIIWTDQDAQDGDFHECFDLDMSMFDW